ncbi:MarR family transcriptional regulator [Wukongibacter baidiensis]|uniref:MarR family winged helix-turn-helix transcriptional regulator n=1 Tax=Wukongibacter baidiensis TaxID=1723361 RepID=UPI003D7FF869
MIEKDKTLQSILNIFPMITETFFENFLVSSDMLKDLNTTHTKTLMTLKYEGGSTMSEISRKIELEKGSFTPVANKLIKLGYIEKVQSVEDRRKSMLRLTELGHSFADRFQKEHTEYIYSQLDKLSEAEQDAYLAAINLVLSLSRKMLEQK